MRKISAFKMTCMTAAHILMYSRSRFAVFFIQKNKSFKKEHLESKIPDFVWGQTSHRWRETNRDVLKLALKRLLKEDKYTTDGNACST